MINVLLADDHTMFVDGIDSILKTESDISVVGKVYNGPDVVQFVKDNKVDLVLLDVNLPDMNGIEVCKALKEQNSETKILGYILKNTGREELLKALRTVVGGKSYFSDDVTQTIMKGLMKQRKAGKQKEGFFPKISRREKEVLRLIIQEHTTQEIANKLFISLKTVESHRSSLLNKMNARNSAGLVRIAIENNLLD